MRKLSPAYVVTSVVIALAGSAYAQTAARPSIGNPNLGANARQGTTTNANGTRSNTEANSATNPNTTNTNGTVTNNNTVLSNTTSGADGSRSGNNTNSSAAASPVGSSGASSANSANTGTENGASPGAVLAPGVSPFINGTAGTITNDGERTTDNSMNGQGNNGNGNVQPQNNGNAGTAVEVEAARNSQNLNRAIKLVERDRKRVGKNGQLLQTIAPRTNADRAHEMPDDGPSPALTGTSSALTRR